MGYLTFDYMTIPKDIPDTLINDFIYLAGPVGIRRSKLGRVIKRASEVSPRNHKATVTPGEGCALLSVVRICSLSE